MLHFCHIFSLSANSAEPEEISSGSSLFTAVNGYQEGKGLRVLESILVNEYNAILCHKRLKICVRIIEILD